MIRSARGPTPCSPSSSARLFSASWSIRVTPIDASARLAGAPIRDRSLSTIGRSSQTRRCVALLSLPYTVIAVTFTLMANVKVRRRGATTISTKHQVTIPVAELRAAGLEAGERLVARADGPGRVILEREHDVLSEFAGALTGAYSDAGLETLRDEWD